jgi:hypothetical protein
MTIFGLKMMMKSGLEFFILKLNEPLQRPARPIQPFWVDFFALGSSDSEVARSISK